MSREGRTLRHKVKGADHASLVSLAAVTLGIISFVVYNSTTKQPLEDDVNIIHHRRLNSLLDEDQALPGIFPLRWPQDYLGFGCAILGLLLAAGGGIGGGGILVPIYILLLEFPVKHAIPLASTTVLGGAIANNLLNVRKAHPDHPERPLIDWDLVLQLEPTTIAGALIGVDLNKELPELVLLVLMLMLLTVTATKTLSKACKLYQIEEKDLAQVRASEARTVTKDTPFIDQFDLETDVESGADTADTLSRSGADTPCSGYNTTSSIDSARSAINRQCIFDALKLVGLFAIVTCLDLLEGMFDGFGSGSIDLDYWASEMLIFIIIVLFSLHVRSSILERQQWGGPVISEIHWDERNTIVYPCLSTIAGLVAGMFGIGGGIVKGPLMLQLGVHPMVASATSACMILFTSCTSTLSYLVFGYLKYDYAAFCLVLGFVSTLVGQTLMSALLESHGQRNSYIAFCIGGVVAISAVAMGVESVVAILGD